MTRNMTTTELTEHKVKELNQLITDLQQNCKELVKAEDEIKRLEQKVENLKNERLNLAITELDKDAIICSLFSPFSCVLCHW
jgi:prefoldin subunit 5